MSWARRAACQRTLQTGDLRIYECSFAFRFTRPQLSRNVRPTYSVECILSRAPALSSLNSGVGNHTNLYLHMAYWDGYTANLFREDAEHRRVIAPWYKRGPVYLVPTDADATRITRTVRLLYQLMLLAILAPLVVFGWRWMIVCALAWLVVFYVVLFAIMHRLPRHPLRADQLPPVARTAMRDRAARAIGPRALWTMLIGSLSFVAIGIWMLFARGSSLIALATVGLFGLYSGVFIYQLRRTSRSNVDDRLSNDS